MLNLFLRYMQLISIISTCSSDEGIEQVLKRYQTFIDEYITISTNCSLTKLNNLTEIQRSENFLREYGNKNLNDPVFGQQYRLEIERIYNSLQISKYNLNFNNRIINYCSQKIQEYKIKMNTLHYLQTFYI